MVPRGQGAGVPSMRSSSMAIALCIVSTDTSPASVPVKLKSGFASTATFTSGPICSIRISCGVPGVESALTNSGERWGLRLAQSASVGHGRWDAHAKYRELRPTSHDRRYELEALAAVRLLGRCELSASTSYARSSTTEAGHGTTLAGHGDTWARVRYELTDEAPPHQDAFPWPSLALTGSLRIPTASTSSSATLGLGAYELNVGSTLERTIASRYRLSASGLLALRGPDDSLGAPRQLGPRLATQLAGSYWARPNLALSVSSNLTWEGEARYAGKHQAGSGSRQWQVGAGLAFRPERSSVRAGFRLRYAPPLPALSVNALGDTSFEVSLAYTK